MDVLSFQVVEAICCILSRMVMGLKEFLRDKIDIDGGWNRKVKLDKSKVTNISLRSLSRISIISLSVF